ncbi:MAG: alpha/beta hydrolase [Pirellulales bacterium]
MRRTFRSWSCVTMLLAGLACIGAIDGVVAGDPRPTADLSAGGEPQADRRLSRRALRRAARRGLPIESQPQPRVEPLLSTRATPIPIAIDATLGSPFQPEATERPTVHHDQPYGTAADPRQRFDIYLPAGCSGGSLPLVVWIPGDEWQGGPRTGCPVTWLVDHGYIVASVGYRSGDTAIFPAQLDDSLAALATLVRDAEIWGIDPARICIMGAGGGGQLAVLVGSARSGQPSLADGDPPPAVAAVCAIAAPSQLTSLGASHDRAGSAASRLVGGPLPELREAALAASPLTHVSPDDPPTLILHGTHDAVIPPDQAVRLDRALAAAGLDHELVLLDTGHAVPLGGATPAATALIQFLDRVLGPGIRAEPPPAGP